jgi:putative transposase
MIDRSHALPVTRQARELGISRGSVYYLPRPTPVADLAVMRRLDELHMDFPFAGSRMLRDLLAADGVKVGRLHVSTLMKKMAIEAIYRRPNTSKPAPGHKVYPYLLRKLAVTRPNQVRATDITPDQVRGRPRIPMARGFVYLIAIVDWFSRRVLAWRLSITLEADFCIAALEEALARFGSPEIFNTDQCSQFTSMAFTSVLHREKIAIRNDGRAALRDNVFVERLWRSVTRRAANPNTRRFTCGPTALSAKPGLRWAGIWLSTTAGARTRRLTARHPITSTSTNSFSQRHKTGSRSI